MLTLERGGGQHITERSASLVGVSEALLDPAHSAGVIFLPPYKLQQLESLGQLAPDDRTVDGPYFHVRAFHPSAIPDDREGRDHLIWQLRQQAILEYRRAFLAGNIGATSPVQERFFESLTILPLDVLCGDDSHLHAWIKQIIVESRREPIALAGVHPCAIAYGSEVEHGYFRAVNDRLTAGDIVGPFVFNQQDDYVFGI